MSMFKKIQLFHSLSLLLVMAVSSVAVVHAGENTLYDHERLQTLAEQHISNIAKILPDQQLQVHAVDLDSRIPERYCEQLPEMVAATSPPFNRQVAVQLKCNSPAVWTQYVHVRIEKLSPIVVAKENIGRGQLIDAQSVTVAMRPQHFVRAQYVEEPELIVGSRSKRSIRQGSPINANQLCMVCKGDNVNIIATINGLTIKTSGEALEDGAIGDNVRVRNVKSGRQVNAQVTAVETVTVNI
ncbi:flagellar basal body P-ring formation chaperone FlgA [Pseudoalteromonas sp. GB56]